MKHVTEYSKQELNDMLKELTIQFQEAKMCIRDRVIALISAIFSVCFIAIILGFIFAPRIIEGWKCAGMFVGTYTCLLYTSRCV